MHLKSKMTDLESVASTPLLASNVALEGGPRRDGWERLRYVLGHPGHLVLLGTLLLIAVFVGSPLMLIPILMVEAFVSIVLPRTREVRTRADRKYREKRRQTAARARSSLVAYMEALHGRELTELERRAAIARSHAQTAGDAMERLIDDWYGVDRLLGAYVRLSIAHRTARESAALTDREKLCNEIRILERERERSTSPRLRRLMGRQLALLRSRAACLERNDEEREALALELSSVASLCRLVHERTFALVSSPDLHNEVDRLVGEMQMQDEAIAEVTGTGREAPVEEDEEEIDVDEALQTGIRVSVLEHGEEAEQGIEPDSRVLLRAGGLR
jgi:hypothetical protein